MTLPADILNLFAHEPRHLSDTDAVDLIDGVLAGERLVKAEAHMAACPRCARLVAQVRDAVEADIAAPHRLDAAVARFTALIGAAPQPDMDHATVTPLAARLKQASASVHKTWRRVADGLSGALTGPAWMALPALADGALGPEASAYEGVQAPLDRLFGADVLRGPLAWSEGPLIVAASYGEEGGFRSIEASVALRPGVEMEDGASIRVTLSDASHREVTLELTPDEPSEICIEPLLTGPLDALSATLSAGAGPT